MDSKGLNPRSLIHIRVGILLLQVYGDLLHLTIGVGDRNAFLDSRDTTQEMCRTVYQLRIDLPLKCLRDPRLILPVGIGEGARHNADDGECLPVDCGCTSDNARIAAEPASPQPVTEDNDVRPAGLFLRAT